MSFPNPFGYHCAPNATDPHYATEHRLERFLGFGLFVCHEHLLGLGCENLIVDAEDVFWLRKDFLDTVELAAFVLPMLRAEAEEEDGKYDGKYATITVPYEGDQAAGGFVVGLKGDPDGLPVEWRFSRLDGDLLDPAASVLMFELVIGDDAFEVWLAASELDRPDVAAVIEEARAASRRSPSAAHEES